MNIISGRGARVVWDEDDCPVGLTVDFEVEDPCALCEVLEDGPLSDDVVAGLMGDLTSQEEEKPTGPDVRVIQSDPATVMFAFGHKTVSKARGGDEFDPKVGVIACSLKHLGMTVDEWEDAIRGVSGAKPKDIRRFAAALVLAAKALGNA